MDEGDIAHLAGVFDAIGSITTHIIKGGGTTIGYRFEPILRVQRPADDAAILGKIDAYCEDYGVTHSMAERPDGETVVFEVKKSKSIVRFLEPMLPYLVINYENAILMLEQILPAIREGDHLTKPGFYHLMEYADKLRESSRYGPEAKYTQEYFADLWDDDLTVGA